jgi:L-alanine-DL-glutamate epimerase-like enolase superfamily enzyme
LEELGVELLEEPLGRGETEALRRLAARTSVPLVADESARTAEEAAALRGCAAGVNVKLSKCGGLRAARAMIAAARGCGLKVMLGCFIESSLGISAAAQLARLADWLDLDGALLLGRDPFEGVRFARDARLRLTDEPGLGVRPSAKYKPNNKP